MPKIFGLNLLGIFIGSVVFFALGWLWYGLLFMEKWARMTGIQMDPNAQMDMVPMVYGFLNVIVVTLGIGLLLKWLNVSNMVTAIKYSLIACVCFSLTTEAYWMIYAQKPLELFLINGSYQLVGYSLVAAIWSFFK
jgi:hypothetical protein